MPRGVPNTGYRDNNALPQKADTKPINDQLNTIVDKWTRDMSSFVREALGVEETEQQKEASLAVSKIVFSKRREYAVRQHESGKKPFKNPKNAILTKDEKYYSAKAGISIMAGRGPGKDAWASWLMMWFMYCYDDVKIPCTGPTGPQMSTILWHEIKKWLNRKNKDGEYACIIRDSFIWQTQAIKIKDKDNLAFWKTSDANDNDEGSGDVSMGGQHQDFMCFLVDEASGVPDKVQKTLFNSMTTGICNFMICIFNPTRNTGFAYDTQYKDETDMWVKLQWSALDCERISPKALEMMIALAGGKGSNDYRISVSGLPPISNSNSVIQREWVELSMKNHMECDPSDKVIMGLDPSGPGKDKTKAVIRQGGVILTVETCEDNDTHALCMWALSLTADYEVDYICIDPIGIGCHLAPVLRNYFPNTVSVNANSSAKLKDKFNRRKDELWYALREGFENGAFSIQAEKHNLLTQLTEIRFKDKEGSSKYQVENKKDLRARSVKSPDEADALMLSMHFPIKLMQKLMEVEQKKDRYLEEDREVRRRRQGSRARTFMSA